MTLKSDAEFEKKLTYCLENDFGIWQILTRALEIVKIGTLMGSFCPKQKTYGLKIGMRKLKNVDSSTRKFVF